VQRPYYSIYPSSFLKIEFSPLCSTTFVPFVYWISGCFLCLSLHLELMFSNDKFAFRPPKTLLNSCFSVSFFRSFQYILLWWCFLSRSSPICSYFHSFVFPINHLQYPVLSSYWLQQIFFQLWSIDFLQISWLFGCLFRFKPPN